MKKSASKFWCHFVLSPIHFLLHLSHRRFIAWLQFIADSLSVLCADCSSFVGFPRQRLCLRRRLVTVVLFLRCRADFVTVLLSLFCLRTWIGPCQDSLQFSRLHSSITVLGSYKSRNKEMRNGKLGNEEIKKWLRHWHPT